MRHLLILLVLTTSNLWSQNGIGLSYSMRMFPLQHSNNNQSYYLSSQSPSSDQVIVSNAFEHKLRFYYQYKAKQQNKTRQVGINIYSSKLEFERSYRSDYSSGGNSGSSHYSYKSGTYDYAFIGASFGSFKNKVLKHKISFYSGYTISANCLVYEHTYNKIGKSTTTYTSTNLSTGDVHSNTSYSNNDQVNSAENILFNAKLEFPLAITYTGNQGSFSLGISPGISTQSRIMVADKGFNLFISPTLSYTYFLKKKSNTN